MSADEKTDRKPTGRPPAKAAAVAAMLAAGLLSATAQAEPLIISANDGLNQMVDGAYHVRPGAQHGSLAGFDASQFPPRKLWEIPADHSAVGPPAGVAVSRDGHFAYVSNPAVPDPQHPDKPAAPAELQIVDLKAAPPAVVDRPKLATRPWGIALNRAGTLLLAASGKGAVYVLVLDGGKVVSSGAVDVGTETARVMSVAITPDGRWALATKRGENTVAVLRIEGTSVSYTGRDITTGSNPYSVVISPDGSRAAVTDIGRSSGDADAVTLVDLASPTFHAAGVVPVAATPEAVTISPDGRFMAVTSINGSNIAHGKPGSSSVSLIQVFDLAKPLPVLAATAEVSANAQGVQFTPDSRHLLVQEFALDRISLFDFDGTHLSRLEAALPLGGGPSAIAATFP
ncbi:beta-propeller fold lactonase family protein [Labrys monachus]|uniref:DNA-binding beta-propeller fold protein YncE n=1 Tax=Labrys monachus TaxID=217067 RepID=A0ABU0FNB7_9HYPH|nr:beta-propeller fold lactonase family protein [Labrys monachus]MDQ0396116.1 DNA-binding beta-propeller fold protein YncE [Labrys monachus]